MFCRFLCRLYFYPIKVLYCAGFDAFQHIPAAPLYFFFNGMLWALFLMNVWWFQFILWLIFRILTGRSRGVEDTREIPKVPAKSPAVNEANHKSLTDGNAVGNRDVSSHGVDYGKGLMIVNSCISVVLSSFTGASFALP